MKQCKYKRNGKNITTIDQHDGKGGSTEQFKSFNAAKRKSRKLQMGEDGALGRGSLRVY